MLIVLLIVGIVLCVVDAVLLVVEWVQGIFSVVLEQKQGLEAKGNKPLHVGLLIHINNDLAIDPIGHDKYLILANHEQILPNITNEPIILQLIIIAIKYQPIQLLMIKELRYEIPLLQCANGVYRRVVQIDALAALTRKTVHHLAQGLGVYYVEQVGAQ